MTLILTEVSAVGVLQVTDRLVSARGREFDPLSNKNVIFLAKDGLVTLGYTGRAYLDGIPTDRWLARKLALDDTIQDDGQGAFELGFDVPERWLTVREAVVDLAEELHRSFSRARNLLGSPFVHVHIAGWQWPARGWTWRLDKARPVEYDVHNNAYDVHGNPIPGQVVVETLPRYWGWEKRQLRVSALPGNWMTDANFSNVAERIRSCERFEEAESAFVDALRSAHRANPTSIGPHCMSIFLPRPSAKLIRARYVVDVSATNAREVDPGYTPWVVAPDVNVAPTIMNGPGNLELYSGPFTFRFEGGTKLVTQPDGSIRLFQSQPRPRDPQGPLASAS